MVRPVWSARAHTVVTVVVVLAVLVAQPAVAFGTGVASELATGGVIGVVVLTALLYVLGGAFAWWIGRSALVGISLAGVGLLATALAVVLSGSGFPSVGWAGLAVFPLAIAVRRGPDGIRSRTPTHPTLLLAPGPLPVSDADRRPRLRASVAAAVGVGTVALQPLVILEFVWSFTLGGPSPTAPQAEVLSIVHAAVVVTLGVLALAVARSVILGVPLLVWGVVSAWGTAWFLGAIPAILLFAILTPIAVARALRPVLSPAPRGRDTP